MDEMSLIKRAQQGDMPAFNELIKPYIKPAYNIALKYLKNKEDAQDISQEAFVKVMKSIHAFKGNSAFSTWLYRIVVNLCHDFYAKSKKRAEALENLSFHYSESDEEMSEQKDKSQAIHEVLQDMDEEKRSILILRDVQGFRYDEIADILNIPIGSVKSKISRAREQFKQIVYSNRNYLEALSIRRIEG